MEADYSDKTAWNQPHATDISLMKHYNVYGPSSGQVLVVSLIEQTLRYYNNGKLVRSFLIVSGQYMRPSVPGFWSIILREHRQNSNQLSLPVRLSGIHLRLSNMRWSITLVGTSSMIAGGGQTTAPERISRIRFKRHNLFNGNGSHGCINMNPNDVAWLYPQIGWGTPVILY